MLSVGRGAGELVHSLTLWLTHSQAYEAYRTESASWESEKLAAERKCVELDRQLAAIKVVRSTVEVGGSKRACAHPLASASDLGV